MAERWCAGTPGGIRTPDPWFRRPVLYSAELRARVQASLATHPCQRALGDVRHVDQATR